MSLPVTTSDQDALFRLQHGFRDQVVVVVGGRGGIGAEVARQAEALGAHVVVASRGVPAAGWGETHSEIRLDHSDAASRAAFVSQLERQFGRIDVLVNTAGVTRSVPLKALDQLDDALIEQVMGANAMGVLALIRDVAPLLRRSAAPCVVNVSSVAARTGVGSNIAYVGAKAAMDAMSISLAKALSPEVRIVNVAPSALDTGFAQGRPADFIDRTIAATPLGRLATTTEVANAILVAARVLTMTTGTTVYVDGGRHL
jgi:3-oxoacyl-[acyl-carrier protein] reductase